jgi:N utilization substance protein A
MDGLVLGRIRLTSDEMRYIALFESVTGAGVKDCVIGDGCLIFVVKPGDAGVAIGRGGSHIRVLRRMLGVNVEVVEYAEDLVDFVKNSFAPARVRQVRVVERGDGERFVVVSVKPSDKGVAIGRNGRKAERNRLLVRRYFGVDDVVIT